MKNSIKTLATWLIIAVIFVVLFSTIWNGANTKMSYSDLLINIKSGNVESIEISASKTSAKVLYKDSNTNNKLTKTVNIPSLDSFMEQISSELVDSELKLEQDEESMVFTLLSAFSPLVIFAVFLFFWILFMNPSQNANKSSLSFGKSKARMVTPSDKNKITLIVLKINYQ